MNEGELLPCPWSGDGRDHDLIQYARRVACSCGAEGPYHTDSTPSSTMVASLWNTRAAPPATTAGAVDEIVRETLAHLDGLLSFQQRASVEAAIRTIVEPALSARTSGEAVVDVPALIEFLSDTYGWNPDGDEDVWAQQMTAALAAQGVPTRAKDDGGGE